VSDINIFDPDYVQKQQLANLRRQADAQNAQREQQYKQASADWRTTNARNQELGLGITPLPTKPLRIEVTNGDAPARDGARADAMGDRGLAAGPQ
jgi:hypothetical protein